jgi:hypothetical protein
MSTAGMGLVEERLRKSRNGCFELTMNLAGTKRLVSGFRNDGSHHSGFGCARAPSSADEQEWSVASRSVRFVTNSCIAAAMKSRIKRTNHANECESTQMNLSLLGRWSSKIAPASNRLLSKFTRVDFASSATHSFPEPYRGFPALLNLAERVFLLPARFQKMAARGLLCHPILLRIPTLPLIAGDMSNCDQVCEQQ